MIRHAAAHADLRFTFDVAERAYLLHWALELHTAAAITLAITLTVAVLLVAHYVGREVPHHAA